jgi:hypothetical protein
MLIVGCGMERLTPVRAIRKLAKKYSHADCMEFADHAHWVLGGPGWQEIAASVADWLKLKLGE